MARKKENRRTFRLDDEYYEKKLGRITDHYGFKSKTEALKQIIDIEYTAIKDVFESPVRLPVGIKMEDIED